MIAALLALLAAAALVALLVFGLVSFGAMVLEVVDLNGPPVVEAEVGRHRGEGRARRRDRQ